MENETTSTTTLILTGHAIGIRLFNNEDQAVLYVDDHNLHGHRLTCEVINVSDRMLEVIPGDQELTPGPGHDGTYYHFALRFRRGLLQSVETLKATDLPEDWKASDAMDEADGITIYFLYTGKSPLPLEPNRSIELAVSGAQANVNRGARTTQVELLFQGLRYQNDVEPLLSGTRLHLLNVVSQLGHRYAPLLFTWIGSHRVLNNGVERTLKLRVLNTQPDHKLEFSIKEDRPTRLIFNTDSKLVKITDISLTRPERTDGGKLAETDGVWTLAADAMKLTELEAGHALEISVKIKAGQESDTAFLHIRCENLPGFWDNSLVLPMDVSPVSFSGPNTGINASIPEAVLHVNVPPSDANGKSLVIGKTTTKGSNLRLGYHEDYSWIQSHGQKPLAINSLGNTVGIGGITDPKARLDVKGDINASGKIRENGHDLLPTGAIIMWSGDKTPEGWVLCDGGSSLKAGSESDKIVKEKKLKIPDLRERFVVGAGESPGNKNKGYALNAEGGANEYQLKEEQLPSHSHAVNLETEQEGKHRHEHYDTYYNWHNTHAGIGEEIRTYSSAAAKLRNDMTQTGLHKHRVKGATQQTGQGKPIDNRPKYYALAFIMKL